MINLKVDNRHFGKVMKQYLKLNKRDNAYLVEATMKKVLTGISAKRGKDGSIGSPRVLGLRQLFMKVKPTPAQIKRDVWDIWRLRVSGRSERTIWTPPKKVDPAGPMMRRDMIHRRIDRIGYLAANFLFNKWRAKNKPSQRLIRTKRRMKATKVIIKTTGRNPTATFESKVPGIIAVGTRLNLFNKALANITEDMKAYIRRKKPSLFDKASNMRN